MKTENPFCTPILQLNHDNAEKIKRLCQPLEQCFGITAFGYLRVFDDGRHTLLSNSDTFLEASAIKDGICRTEHFSNQTEFMCRHETYKNIWPDDVRDESIELFRARGHHHGFNITKEFEGSLEGCWFTTTIDNPEIKTLYKNHSNLLEDFMTYFRMSSGTLTDPSESEIVGLSPHMKNTYPKIDMAFKKTTPWERKIVGFNSHLKSIYQQEIIEFGREFSLTPRELECLSYFTTGKTAKEIARLMGVAHRTVDSHLESIRLKTGLRTKIELTQWFEEKFRPYLSKSFLFDV